MKKVVLKLDFADEKMKQKAMIIVSALSGLESVAMDKKDKKLTITGDIDPVKAVAKLRKLCPTEMLSLESVKKEEPNKGGEQKNKDGNKGDDQKNKDGNKGAEQKNKDGNKGAEQKNKDGNKGDDKKNKDGNKGDDQKNKDGGKQEIVQTPMAYHHQQLYYNQYPPPGYLVSAVEEDPNSCVIG